MMEMVDMQDLSSEILRLDKSKKCAYRWETVGAL